MMANDNHETTTSFKVDISELKSEFQEAQRIIRVANSEFKAASAGMDDWGSSADGLTAKIDQLSTVLDAEKTKLDSLQRQYDLTAQEMGANSKAAQDLQVKLNNQRAAVSNVERQLGNYQTALSDLENATESLSDKVKRQESELSNLKNEYARVATEQGQNSAAAQTLANRISQLSGELNENRTSLRNAEDAADSFDQTLDDVDSSAENAEGGIGTFQIALGNLVADGIQAVLSGLKDMVTELGNTEGAYNSFQAKTGATTKEMAEFKEEMNDLYKNNYGESLEDIADKMAYVKQVTGEVDPSNIRELTENAIALEDTFGSDFNETIRGTNNLMKHFGIDSNKAFDLFAKGSQEGLDYTSELGDNIAEYGGNFAQAGYSAEEYFQLLKNGSQGGAYNLDKVNDSINEVKNRLGDGTIEKNIESFSKGTQTVFKGWQSGEKTMKDVINSIIKDISDCTDEQDALTMAATAFGTMGEDANLDVVKSLTTLGDTFDDVNGKMEEIKDIKYDDVMSQLSSLGRTIQTDVLLPIVEQALPKIREGIAWVTNNLDTLVPTVTTIAGIFAAMWAVTKISTFITSISGAITVIKGMTLATQAQTAAQTALNATNPFGWVALAISAIAILTPMIIGLVTSGGDLSNTYAELTAEEQALIDETNRLAEAYDNFKTSKEQSMASVDAEFAYYNDLKNELDGIVDANGRVKKGYEDRAAFITNTLSQALGIEIDITDGVIQKYDELKDSIEDVINAKKAEALLTSLQDEYTTAIKNKNDALINYTKTQDAYNNALKEQQNAQKEFNDLLDMGEDAWATQNGLIEGSIDAYWGYKDAVDEAREKVKGFNSKFAEQDDAFRESEKTYLGYIETIQNYEGVSAAIISGDVDKINDALGKLEHGFVTAENGTKRSLENQVYNYKDQLKTLEKAIKDGTPGVTQAQVDQMADLVKKSEAELAKLAPQAKEAGTDAANDFSAGIDSKTTSIFQTARNISKEANDGLSSSDTESTGEDFATGFGKGIDNQKSSIWATAHNFGKSALNAMRNALDMSSPSREAIAIGELFSESVSIGIADGTNDVTDAVTQLADNIVNTMDTDEVFDVLLDDVKDMQSEEQKVIQKTLDAEEKAVKKTLDAEAKAFSKKQQEETASLEKVEKKELERYEQAHNKRIALINKEYVEKMKLIDEDAYKATKEIEDQISAINAKTDAEEQVIKETENQKKRAELEDKFRAAATLEERKEIGQELLDFDASLAREKELAERDAEIAKLEKAKANIQSEHDEKIAKIEDEQSRAIDGENNTYSAGVANMEAYFNQEKTKLEEEQEIALDNFKEQQSTALENLNERHSAYMDNVKKEQQAEIDSLKRQKEEALALIDELSNKKASLDTSIEDTVGAFKKSLTDDVDFASDLFNLSGRTFMTPAASENTGTTSTGTETAGNVNNFYQYNTSPKSLSRVDIYRQTKNQLNFAGGVNY